MDNIRSNNTVRRTSPGFVLLERCLIGALTAQETIEAMSDLRTEGQLSFNDVNQDGVGYVEVRTEAQIFIRAFC